jgi:predicted nucleotidyltransferase
MKNFLEIINKLDTIEKPIVVEGISDIPRKTYAKGVFDNAETNNPKLKQSVLNMIMKTVKEDFEKYAPVVSVMLIGSILTKRYRNDADLDLDLLLDVPPADRLTMREAINNNLKNINGKLIPGTKHPINYYVHTDPQINKDHLQTADGVYDVMKNKFVRKPVEQSFDSKQYEADFQKKVKEIDVVKGELQRDIIDYKELQELEPSDIENLQSLVSKKLTEIENAIIFFDKLGQDLAQARRDLYNRDLTPDEIRQYGIHHKLPKNVIYKYLEKYHYLKFFKKCKEIMKDGKITNDEIDSISEATSKSVAFTFGRFNPPTIGHEKLINKVKSVPANDYRIYLSKSVDTKKNPLSPREKLDYMKKIFPQHASTILLNPTNMVLDIATDLYKKGFSDITMVVGSDRVREFDSILKKYNDVKGKPHGYYNFNSIKVVSAGERDPDAEGAMGMSASKMRAAAEKGDIQSFKKGLPTSYRDVEKLFKDVRKGMNLNASFANHFMGYQFKPIASMEEFEQNQIRDLYVREMIFNIGDKINNVNLNVEGTVVRRGTNYIVMEDSENNLHKAWIWDCIPVASDKEAIVREYNLDVDYGFQAVSEIDEDKKSGHTRRLPQDKSVSSKKGTQPKKYYKGLSKDVKSKRDTHFKSQDTTKGPYKPAPGDDTAKTKPSKHTQKFKKMFGELKVDLTDACWKGFKQVGMKTKNGKQVPNCVPEAYDIGHDYANYTSKITPGEPQYDPKFQGEPYKPSNPKDNLKRVVNDVKKGIIDRESSAVTQKDIKEWSISDAVIHKYRERYKEQWREKLDEVVDKMMKKLELDNNA